LRNLISVLFLVCADALQAQSPVPAQFPTLDPNAQSNLQMEIMQRAVEESKDDSARRAIAKREEEIARTQFCARANRFVTLWMDFAQRLNEKQTFDAKLAKKLAKAFHDLETSEGWPVRDTAK
jgi:hypothetical protein